MGPISSSGADRLLKWSTATLHSRLLASFWLETRQKSRYHIQICFSKKPVLSSFFPASLEKKAAALDVPILGFDPVPGGIFGNPFSHNMLVDSSYLHKPLPLPDGSGAPR